MLLEGPAGIGKTSVLDALAARARDAGLQVLRCSPTETETAMPLVALADLLAPLGAESVELPEPQRRARDAVLAMDDSHAIDERALGSATRTLLDAAAERTAAGVLVAIDDAPWLDPPSERALRFALRRTGDRVRVVAGQRTTDRDDLPVPLGLDAAKVERVQLAPLGIGPLHHVLRNRFDVSLSRPLVVRLANESGGNPLLAIELTRAMLRLPALPGPGDDLPVPASMHELVAASLATLPTHAVRAMRLIALMSSPHLSDLSEAGISADSIDAGEEAGLVTVVEGARVRFVHPAQGAAVRASIPSGVRRGLHAHLAATATDPDERARHLARSAAGRDPDAARELADAAARARARGAPELAAELYDRAAGLAGPGGDFALRLQEVQCLFDAGNYPLAATHADAWAATLRGEQLAEVLLLRAVIAFSADDLTLATATALRALDAAPAGSRLAGRIHAHIAVFIDAPVPARHHAEAAHELLVDGPADDRSRRPRAAGRRAARVRAVPAVPQRGPHRPTGSDGTPRPRARTRSRPPDVAGRHHPGHLVEGHRRAAARP